MIFRSPSRQPERMGRNLQFTNPLHNSNKKHYWSQGIGNHGFLTTEQIQMLDEFRKRELKANLDELKQIRLNSQIRQLKYGSDSQMKESNIPPIVLQKHGRSYIKQRSVSEYRQYPDIQYVQDESLRNLKSVNRLEHHQNDQQKNINQMKSTHHRRTKTLGIEKNDYYEEMNQSPNQVEKMFDTVITSNKVKPKSRHMQINSGSVHLSYSPSSISPQKQQSKTQSMQKKNLFSPLKSSCKKITSSENLQQKKYSSQLLENNEMELEQKLLNDVKIIQPRIITHKALRRDHSPTYCNSIEYPLRYYRHV